MWFTGIDWADDHHDICLLDEAGQVVVQERVAHRVAGMQRLVWLLTQQTGVEHKDAMVSVIETPHGLLVNALIEAGFAVYPVNPKTVDRWRKPSGAKTDQIDAYLLAKVGRSDWRDLKPLQPSSSCIQELKTLVRDQQHLLSQQSRLINQLKACLKTYYPSAVQALPKVEQKSTQAFLLAYPTPEAAAQASVDEMATVLKTAGHPRAETVAPHLWQEMQRPALQADAATIRAKARLMEALVHQLGLLAEEIEGYDRAIAEVFAQHQDHAIFESLPGAGKRIAPRLLAELGDNAAVTQDVRVVQMMAGTAPVCKQSGHSHQVFQRQACIKGLRDVVYLFCLQTIKLVPWAKAYYHEKRTQGKPHALAIRDLACVWIRIICAMRRTQTSYCESIFVAAQQAHRPQAA